MQELSSRQQSILGVVIRSYISNAQPVSSKALLEHSSMDVSSATVRNEMSALESMGYHVQSAGSQGTAHSIRVDPATGMRVGAADPRDADAGAAGH